MAGVVYVVYVGGHCGDAETVVLDFFEIVEADVGGFDRIVELFGRVNAVLSHATPVPIGVSLEPSVGITVVAEGAGVEAAAGLLMADCDKHDELLGIATADFFKDAALSFSIERDAFEELSLDGCVWVGNGSLGDGSLRSDFRVGNGDFRSLVGARVGVGGSAGIRYGCRDGVEQADVSARYDVVKIAVFWYDTDGVATDLGRDNGAFEHFVGAVDGGGGDNAVVLWGGTVGREALRDAEAPDCDDDDAEGDDGALDFREF